MKKPGGAEAGRGGGAGPGWQARLRGFLRYPPRAAAPSKLLV